MTRKLSEIAREIIANIGDGEGQWGTVASCYAGAYLRSMLTLSTLDDRSHLVNTTDVVNHFLCNAQSWRGDPARRIKAELRAMLKEYDK